RWPRDWSSDVCSSDLDLEDLTRILSGQKAAHSHLQNSTLLSWEQEVQNRRNRGHVCASATLRHRDRVPHGGTGCRTRQRRTAGRSEERRVGKEGTIRG